MERVIKIHVEKLPEGIYLATTDDIQGLVAQGRTVAETLEIARDVARKLVEEQGLNGAAGPLPAVTDRSDFAVVVEA
jgi:predicted RNase H-like HicB family nuclease